MAPQFSASCCYQGDIFEDFTMELPDLNAPEFNSSNRLNMLQQQFGSKFYKASESENIIWMGVEGDEPPRVVTRLSFFARKDGKATRPYRIVDPKTGEVLDEYDGLTWQDDDDDEEGEYYYEEEGHSGEEYEDIIKISAPTGTVKEGDKNPNALKDIEVRKINDDECHLETKNVITLKLNKEGQPETKDEPVRFECSKPPIENVNGGLSTLTDAHRNADKVLKFFQETYDDDHMLLNYGQLNVEVGGLAEDNAFWDGDSVIIYNGKTRFHPLVELVTVAHEVTHALISSTSDLEYRGQSGGINEAFADITGKTLEAYLEGEASLQWTVGRKVTKKEKAIRFMDDPPKDGKSIDHVADYEGLAKKDVHYTSGVFNKLFFELVQQPSFDVFTAYDVFYVANKYYFKRRVKFVDAGEDLLTAFDDLKMGRLLDYLERYDEMKEEDLLNALEKVGIGCEKKAKSGSARRSRGKKYDCEALPKGGKRGRVKTKKARVRVL